MNLKDASIIPRLRGETVDGEERGYAGPDDRGPQGVEAVGHPVRGAGSNPFEIYIKY